MTLDSAPVIVESQKPASPRFVGRQILANKKILIVDDSPSACSMVARTLSSYGGSVTTVYDATHALGLLDSESFDVLVSDLCMPDIDGHALITQIRTGGASLNHDVPAVVLSGQDDVACRKRSLQEGFQTHLAKPADPEHLATVVAWLADFRKHA